MLTAYLPLWLADRGLSAGQIGQVLGVASLVRVVAMPGWGWASDAMGRQRAMLAAAAGCAAGCAAALPWAMTTALLALVAIQGVAASALAPLSDAITLALAAARRLDYGRARAWGSVSYMLATAGAGALLGQTGSGLVPWLLVAGYGGAALLAAGLPAVDTAERGVATGLFSSGAFRLALAATAAIQGSHAAYYGFAGLYWRQAGIADRTIGLLIAEGIVAEIVLFLWGRRLVERLGPARLTAVAACACVLRWLATAATVEVAALAVIQLLHAATFACQHLSTMLVLRTLPARRAGMAQTLISALGFSAPTGVLIWMTGRLYAPLGGGVFLVMAAVGATGMLTVRGLRRLMPHASPLRA